MNKNDVLLGEYVKLYELALSYEGKTPATLSIYMSNLRRFCRYMETALQRPAILSDFTPDAVIAYVTALKNARSYEDHPTKAPSDKPISPASIDQHVRTLKGFSTWLYEKRYTRLNVLTLLPRPKLPKLTIEPLTDTEIKRLLGSINTRTPYGARNYAVLCRRWPVATRTTRCFYLFIKPGWQTPLKR